MCGIVVLSMAGTSVERHRMDRALGLVAHRGPDGEGLLIRREGRLALGHRRLAIFSPGPEGRQPMVSPGGDALVFNGCIYNYPELRAELVSLGHVFATDGDTEVVLAAWRQWGEDAFARFNGDWALVLHDAAGDRLIICRDRLGVRPLYALTEPGRLVVASEVRAVLAASGRSARPDAGLAYDFLAMGLSDHEDRTMVEGVVQVPAGAVWVQDAQGRLSRRRYHHWPAQGSVDGAAAAAALPALLADATRLRLRSHVPVAAQLSGGMDSGSIAWAIGREGAGMTAPFLGFFSYGYTSDGAEFDEIAAARATRDHVVAEAAFTEVRVDPTPSLQDVETFLAAQELPVSTPSPLAGMRLYRAMRDAGATVALTGDGSDELMGGYTRRYLPVAFRDALLGGGWGRAVALGAAPELEWRPALARLAWSLPFPALSAMMERRPHMHVLADGFRGDHSGRLRDLVALQTLPLAELGRRDAEGGLLAQILRYADRNAMAAGMESRSPFLDYRVAELAMGLAMEAKLGVDGGKLPLRRAMAPHLPPRVIQGPKNRGLGHAEQFRIGQLDLTALLADPPAGAKGLIDCSRLSRMLARHPGDPRLWWSVCMLLWLRQVERQWP